MAIDPILPPDPRRAYETGSVSKDTGRAKRIPRAEEQTQAASAQREPARPESPDQVSPRERNQGGNEAIRDAWTPADAQALQDQIRQAQARVTSQQEISRIGQSLIKAKEELQRLTQERLEETLGAAGREPTYWGGLDLEGKAQVINRLKEQIRSLELERTTIIKMRQEQVRAGEYRVTGAEILQGMLEEFF